MSRGRSRALRAQGFTNDANAYFSEAHASASAIFSTLGQVNHHLEDFYRNHEEVQCPELVAVQHYAREAERRLLEDLVPRLYQDFPDFPEDDDIHPAVPEVPAEQDVAGEEPPAIASVNPEVIPDVLNEGMDTEVVIPPGNAAPEYHGQI